VAAQVFESDRGAICEPIKEDRPVTNTPRKEIPPNLTVPRGYVPGVFDELVVVPYRRVPAIPHLLSPLYGGLMRS
jgi:hypothetical protein